MIGGLFNIITGTNVGNVVNAVVPHNRLTPEENFAMRGRTAEEKDEYEVQIKLECIRTILESCIKKDHSFDSTKVHFVVDFVKSIGFGIATNIKYDVDMTTMDDPTFIVSKKSCSEDMQAMLGDNEFKRMNLMEYHFQQVIYRGETKDIFYMKRVTQIKTA